MSALVEFKYAVSDKFCIIFAAAAQIIMILFLLHLAFRLRSAAQFVYPLFIILTLISAYFGYYLININLLIKNDYAIAIAVNKEQRYFFVTTKDAKIKIPYNNVKKLKMNVGSVIRHCPLGHIKLVTTDNTIFDLTISNPQKFSKLLNDEMFFYSIKQLWYKPSWHKPF